MYWACPWTSRKCAINLSNNKDKDEVEKEADLCLPSLPHFASTTMQLSKQPVAMVMAVFLMSSALTSASAAGASSGRVLQQDTSSGGLGGQVRSALN